MEINALSLFSGAGIGELNLHQREINFIAANEIIEKRANTYKFFYPETKMFIGDITNQNVKNDIIEFSVKNNVNFLIATPPCQGFSSAGKQKIPEDFTLDKRNFLVLEVFDFIDRLDLDYILIENVPRFLKMYFPFNDSFFTLEEILQEKYKKNYNIDIQILNAKDYGVGQSRPRAIIKLWKKTLTWNWPNQEPEIPLSASIGNLPSLEPGEKSNIKWHEAKTTRENIITALRHTKPGTSALTNDKFYPKKKDGTRIKGFHNTYKRMTWDSPASARTTYSGSVSSHNNVHPGRLLPDGTYSDPRVLTLLETFLVSSIDPNIKFPKGSTDSFIRTVIGEAIPPKMTEKICFPNNSEFGV